VATADLAFMPLTMAIRRPPPPQPTSKLVPGESLEEVHPIRLARILSDQWQSLPETTRGVILEELVEGGVLQSATTGPATASKIDKFVRLAPEQEDIADRKMQNIRTQLKMQDGPLDLVEVLSLLTALADHLSTLHSMLYTVWGAWQNLKGDKRIQPTAASRRPIIECLRESLHQISDSGELTAALHDQIAAARLLIAILSGLGQGSQAFAKTLSDRLAPDAVLQSERKSRGVRSPSAEDLLNRYHQLCSSMTPSEIEHNLLLQVVEIAETFYHASKRP
jgi:hypothetical protein